MGRTTRREWVPLILVAALGYSATPLLPIWLAAATERFLLTPMQSGMLGSLELACIAVASIVAAARSCTSRVPLAVAVTISIAGNLASFLSVNVAVLMISRAIVGLSYGVVLAQITRRAAQMPDPHRAFAAQQLGLVVFAAAFFSTISWGMALGGPSAPFLYNSGLGVLALASLAWLRPSDAVERLAESRVAVSSGASPSRGWFTPAVIATFLAITLCFAAYTANWANIETAARASNVPLRTLSLFLAIGSIFNLAAPLASGAIGNRWGRIAPLVLGHAGLGLSVFLISAALGAIPFAVGAVCLSLCMIFLGPFLLGALADRDSSGRAVAAGPAFFMVGSAIGPAAGGVVLGFAGLSLLGLIAVSTLACALLLILAAGAKDRPS